MADNSIVQGLFGVDPTQYQQQQQNRLDVQAQDFAMMSPMQRAQYQIYKGAGNIGAGAGQLLGVQDPALKKAQMAQQLARSFDLTTAEGMRKYASALSANGAPEIAQHAITEANKLESSALESKYKGLQISGLESKAAQEAKLRDALSKVDPNDEQAVMNVYRQFGSPDHQAAIMERGWAAKDKAQAKEDTAKAKQEDLNSTLLDSATEGKGLVDKIRQQVGWNTVGAGSALAWLPMTDARKFASDVETLKSQLTMAAMNAAKAQSKTGATGFGALNSKELKVLQTQVADLDPKLTPAQFNEKLNTIYSHFNKLEQKVTGGTQVADTQKYADDYAQYKAKYKDQALPYAAYVSARDKQ